MRQFRIRMIRREQLQRMPLPRLNQCHSTTRLHTQAFGQRVRKHAPVIAQNPLRKGLRAQPRFNAFSRTKRPILQRLNSQDPNQSLRICPRTRLVFSNNFRRSVRKVPPRIDQNRSIRFNDGRRSCHTRSRRNFGKQLLGHTLLIRPFKRRDLVRRLPADRRHRLPKTHQRAGVRQVHRRHHRDAQRNTKQAQYALQPVARPIREEYREDHASGMCWEQFHAGIVPRTTGRDTPDDEKIICATCFNSGNSIQYVVVNSKCFYLINRLNLIRCPRPRYVGIPILLTLYRCYPACEYS